MKKILLPLITAFTFLIFLAGIRFVEKDRDLYLTSNIFRTEPKKLKPGFRFVPPLIYRISDKIPEERQIQLQTAKPKSIRPANLSDPELLSYVNSLFNNQEFKRAVSACRSIPEKRLNSREPLLLLLAESLLETGDPADSLYYLYKALSININNYKTYLLMSKAYLRMENYQNAAESISQALLINPYDRQSLIQAFYTSLSLKEHTNCAHYLDTLHNAHRNDPDVLVISIHYYLIDNPGLDRAKNYLDMLRKVKPDHFLLDMYSGIYSYLQADYLKAIELLQKECNIPKYNYYRLLFLSRSFSELGMYKDAILHAKGLIPVSPDRDDSFFYLASLHSRAGLIKDAVEYILKIDENRRKWYYPDAYEILLQSENYDLCIRLLKNMLGSDPYNYSYYNHLGSIYLRKKDMLLSLQSYKKSMEIFPYQQDIKKIISDIEAVSPENNKEDQ